MTRLNVLITSSYYWPEDTANAPYVTGLAEHLSERGHNVVVATGFAHYPDWKSSARGRLTASETHNGVGYLDGGTTFRARNRRLIGPATSFHWSPSG